MEENSPRVSRKSNHGTPEVEASRVSGLTRKNIRYAVDDGGDLIECSGKYCRSCTGGLVADCVAVCCCPCAVVNCLGFAFVKAPWMVGRRCLGLGNNKKKKSKRSSKCKRCHENDAVLERDKKGNSWRKERVEEGMHEIVVSEYFEEEEMRNGSARFEAEKVWLELYQIGHLGFGRVSSSTTD
ncbi:Chromo domain-containing protein isoform 1 [Quillaja saponaria]|uniref:Chromo domain-containing protein isoform 1 n=1 Tax=Quillaja saponaria TaxID=32244 RepID=A0AAD7Q4F1_QUISA|nr:Chromo domain-containing protein isoform 1 [Quillaja saponaria]